MRDTMALILSGNNEPRVSTLTEKRSIAAVPYAGRYRIIDFILSDIANSGIINVGIATTNRYRSLMDHLGTGREWDLSRKVYGLTLLPPYMEQDGANWSQGTIDMCHGVSTFIARSQQKYMLLATGGNVLYNTTYYDLQRFHIEKRADISILCHQPKDRQDTQFSRSAIYETDADGRITRLEVRPEKSTIADPFVGMNLWFMEKALFQDILSRAVAKGLHHLHLDVLMPMLNDLRVYAYPYDGYVGRIDSVNSYYRTSMDLLRPEVRQELFSPASPIYTKVRDEVPTQYLGTGSAHNSLLADGCIVEGHVENSVLFRGVRVGRDAVVRNSILMQDTIIQDQVHLDHAVLDKEVVVTRGISLMGTQSYPIVVEKQRIIT